MLQTPACYEITNRADMARVLREARMARGETCEALDARAGFSDRYVAKLEHPDTPSGKRGLQLSYMAEIWIRALGYRLVLVPECVAESLGVRRVEVDRTCAG
jgi:hypothetical protein